MREAARHPRGISSKGRSREDDSEVAGGDLGRLRGRSGARRRPETRGGLSVVPTLFGSRDTSGIIRREGSGRAPRRRSSDCLLRE